MCSKAGSLFLNKTNQPLFSGSKAKLHGTVCMPKPRKLGGFIFIGTVTGTCYSAKPYLGTVWESPHLHRQNIMQGTGLTVKQYG